MAAALVVAGCVGGSARDRYYTLPVPESSGTAAVQLPGTVRVERPQVDGIYSERAMVRAAPGGPLRQQYDNAFWIESPARLVQSGLLEAWRQDGLADYLVPPPLGRDGRWRIAARLLRLDRVGPPPGTPAAQAGGARPAAVLKLELTLLRADTGTIVVRETYRQRVPADDASFAAYARAAGTAVQQAATAFSRAIAEQQGG